jgi:hypothetical protein
MKKSKEPSKELGQRMNDFVFEVIPSKKAPPKKK